MQSAPQFGARFFAHEMQDGALESTHAHHSGFEASLT